MLLLLLLLFNCSVVSSSLLLHGLQDARLLCPHVILKKKTCHFPDGSVVKNLPGNVEVAGDTGFIPGWKIPWRRKWQSTPVFLPGKPPGQRSLVGYTPWGHKELDMIEHTHAHF